MPVVTTIETGKVPVKIYTKDIEPDALNQLKNLSQLSIIYPHVAAMPDVHCGKGSTIGAIIPTMGAIIPSAVGVDIGCGMMATQLSIKASHLPDNLKQIRTAIEKAVPLGFDKHTWQTAKEAPCLPLQKDYDKIMRSHPELKKKFSREPQRWILQMGTLGGGNHFIEVCVDENQYVWIMLHSGSRGIGNAIGTYFIDLAKQDMGAKVNNLPDKDLAYFIEGSSHCNEYLFAVTWAQNYASINRQEMMYATLEAIAPYLPPFHMQDIQVNCHHNYVVKEKHFDKELYITRKGAIRAGLNELGIIPGSMGTKSFIVRGLGNPDSFCSCSHGAGRCMSRTKAKKRFNRSDLIEQTKNIECRKDANVIDEIPGAYKDINKVMENQSDLIEIVHTLKQVVCIKG